MRKLETRSEFYHWEKSKYHFSGLGIHIAHSIPQLLSGLEGLERSWFPHCFLFLINDCAASRTIRGHSTPCSAQREKVLLSLGFQELAHQGAQPFPVSLYSQSEVLKYQQPGTGFLGHSLQGFYKSLTLEWGCSKLNLPGEVVTPPAPCPGSRQRQGCDKGTVTAPSTPSLRFHLRVPLMEGGLAVPAHLQPCPASCPDELR